MFQWNNAPCCILKIGQKACKIKSFIPYLDTNLKLNDGGEESDDYEEIEKVDSDKFYSALKYYTTNFEWNTFKEHFGDGANTESEMVDSWYRAQEFRSQNQRRNYKRLL